MSDEQDQDLRIARIFHQAQPPGVKPKTLRTMLEYLNANLALPCRLTGAMDFEWEEYFVRGGGSPKMYAVLRENRPSYKDFFELLKLLDKFDQQEGIIASVKRESDGKTFDISLVDLKVVDEASLNAQLVDDYAAWVINYG